jgi:8-oxo-dGTP pyrophosphatase MutT (NUDIX family)
VWVKPEGLKAASVAVLIVRDQWQWWTLIIRRPSWMREHPAQFGFPGGKREPADKTLWETAQRETAEEVGISLKVSQCLGCLEPVVIPVTGYWIWPWLVGLSARTEPDLNSGEVAEARWIRLEELWTVSRTGPLGIMYPTEFGTIWGASARIIGQLRPGM